MIAKRMNEHCKRGMMNNGSKEDSALLNLVNQIHTVAIQMTIVTYKNHSRKMFSLPLVWTARSSANTFACVTDCVPTNALQKLYTHGRMTALCLMGLPFFSNVASRLQTMCNTTRRHDIRAKQTIQAGLWQSILISFVLSSRVSFELYCTALWGS